MKRNKIEIPDCVNCDNENSVFCCLAIEDLENVQQNKGDNFFKKGQVIFYEGNHPHGMYCIYRGKVKVSKLGEEGKDQIIRFASNGDILGYRAVLSGEAYQATATAMEDCYVCHLSQDKIFHAMKANSKLSFNIIQLLAHDLRNSEEKLLNISQKPVRERVAEALILLKKKFGLKDDDQTLDVSLTRREIGDISGVTTETTIRTLSDFNKEKLIKLEGKKIKILDYKKLFHTANLYD